MKLADTGYTADEIKAKASKYMIETYERFDFIAETAKEQYVYDENGEEVDKANFLDDREHCYRISRKYNISDSDVEEYVY